MKIISIVALSMFSVLLVDNAFGNYGYYAGHMIDRETGLVYAKMRYYSPHLGKFTSPDPLFVEHSNRCLVSVAECNLFSYAANNPRFYNDPDGLTITKGLPRIASHNSKKALAIKIAMQRARSALVKVVEMADDFDIENGSDKFTGVVRKLFGHPNTRATKKLIRGNISGMIAELDGLLDPNSVRLRLMEGSDSENGTFAAADIFSGGEMDIHDGFFKMKEVDQVITVLHELTHLTMATDDHQYSKYDTSSNSFDEGPLVELASKNSTTAKDNADNWGFLLQQISE